MEEFITMEEFIINNRWLIILLISWSLAWKGLALWKASKREEKWWFVIFLIVNTMGFLEMLYLFVFTKRSKKQEKKEELPQKNETI